MIIYYIVFFIISVLALMDVLSEKWNDRKSLNAFLIMTAFVIFTSLTCFKGQVGSDYANYKYYYDNVLSGDVLVEPIYRMLMYLFRCIGFSFVAFWGIISFLNIWLKFYLFKKLSPYLYLTLLLYFSGLFFMRDFDGIRQGIAIGISYLSVLKYMQKKYTLFCVVNLIAVGFHYTSLTFFLIPILASYSLKHQYVCLLVLSACIITFVLKLDIFKCISDLLPSNIVTWKLHSYSIDPEYSKTIGFSVGVFFRILILLLFSSRNPQKMGISLRYYNILKNGLLLAVLFEILFNNFQIIAYRGMFGFREFTIFMIPLFLKVANGKLKCMVFTQIVLYALILLIRLLNTPNIATQYQYYTIFDAC